MNGLYVAIFLLVLMIAAGVLVAVKAWRQRRATQQLVALTWSNIYHDGK